MFRDVNHAVAWKEIDHRRQELGSYLRSLTDNEWDQPSLCEGWRVRDVVAHLILEYHYKNRDILVGFVRYPFDINTFIEKTALQRGQLSSDELMQQFIRLIGDRSQPFGGPLNVLADLLIHEQDIRIPLSHPKPMPMSSLKLLLSHWDLIRLNLGERLIGIKKRSRGLKFQATDIPFEIGTGPLVEGKAEDLLLIISGRATALNYLTGNGVAIIRSRIKKPER